MSVAHINIGSNQNREKNIALAARALAGHFPNLRFSSLYIGAAVGFSGDDFYNLGVNVKTDLSAEKILSILRRIEKNQHRDRSGAKFSNRTIDLDLVIYGDLVDKNLNLPRADILQYAFVLAPLAELNPEARHPEQKKTYRELYRAFDDVQKRALKKYNLSDIFEDFGK